MRIDIVTISIKQNEKRINKLSTLDLRKRREKARSYVVTEDLSD